MNVPFEDSLIRPTVKGEVDHFLNLDDIPLKDNVEVEWPGMRPLDNIYLTWTTLDNLAFYREDRVVVSEDTAELFSIPLDVVLASEGAEVVVVYQVVRRGEFVGNSPQTVFLINPRDIAPIIHEAIADGVQPIPDGGSTGASYLELVGETRPRQSVKIFHNQVEKGQTRANAQGRWTFSDFEVELGVHSYVATAMYGSQHSSAPYTVTRVDELTIDRSVLVLDGVHLHPDLGLAYEWVRPEGSYRDNVSVRRTASGGKPPYRYASAEPAVAIVDETGLVTSQRDGATVIEVRDDSYQVARFTVTCSNNLNLLASEQGTSFTFAQAKEWVEASPLNHPIPHHQSPLGYGILRDMQHMRSVASQDYAFHTEALNPGSSNVTNVVVAHSAEAGGHITEAGPVGLEHQARAICYRDR